MKVITIVGLLAWSSVCAMPPHGAQAGARRNPQLGITSEISAPGGKPSQRAYGLGARSTSHYDISLERFEEDQPTCCDCLYYGAKATCWIVAGCVVVTAVLARAMIGAHTKPVHSDTSGSDDEL